jgi:ABC-2 type transport system permease protein
MAQPKPVLLNVLASRMSLTAIGDFLFGLTIYLLVGNHTLQGALLFALGLLISGLLFLFVTLAAGTTAFFLGNAEGMASLMFNAFIALSTYPTDIFKGMARLLLFSLIPAGFISYMPIGLLRGVNPGFLAAALCMTALAGFFSIWLFHKGLKRYASGNQMAMRS